MSEQRLIDGNAVLDYLENLEPKGGNAYYRDGCNDMLHGFFPEIIRDAPTIEPPAAQWISIEDRLPEDRKNVLCLCKNKGMTVSRITFRCGNSVSFVQHRGVTHWMPLPEPPMVKL